MTAQTILPANSVTGGFNVGNSVRFNRADSAILNKTFDDDGTHHDKGTISLWIKRNELGAEEVLFSAGANNREFIRFETNDTLTYRSVAESYHLNTNRVFRDVSAWYHIVVAFDSSQGTASNRNKIYVNGVQETSFATETYTPNQNMDHKLLSGELNSLGKDSEQNTFAACYFCEVVGIDGVAHDPTSFGEFDEDTPTIWKPKSVSGLTFGTNGFHLNFADSSALGTDVSGNGNNFANTNLAATDQSTDTCTNNFATMSSINNNNFAGGTFAEGNLQVTSRNTGYSYNVATVGVANGKWYWEVKWSAQNTGSTNQVLIGVAKRPTSSTTNYLGVTAWGYGYQGSDGNVLLSNSALIGYASYSVGDIIGVALDMDNNRLYFSKNGTYNNSSDPANGTNPISITAADSVAGDSGFYFPAFGDGNSNLIQTAQFNFGAGPPYAISSGNADGDGFGNFEFAVPSGYFALCTKNLAEYG
jgi:hypothetical protein